MYRRIILNLRFNICRFLRKYSQENENKHITSVPERKDPALIKATESRTKLQQHIQMEGPLKVYEVSGVPEEHVKTRLVRIFKPTKNATQSASNNTLLWKMQFDTRERWENPLMGWISSGDPLSCMEINFATEKEAIDFCTKNGWKYYVDEVHETKPKLKSYADNFSWNKRTRTSTK